MQLDERKGSCSIMRNKVINACEMFEKCEKSLLNKFIIIGFGTCWISGPVLPS